MLVNLLLSTNDARRPTSRGGKTKLAAVAMSAVALSMTLFTTHPVTAQAISASYTVNHHAERAPLYGMGRAALLTTSEWRAFKGSYVRSDGRVVDVENAGVSHSESQGYGMLFAAYANDRQGFDQIWRFTRTRLQRSDGLFAWRWIEHSHTHIPDWNNASDGDIFIAYALLRAALQWNDPMYVYEASRIIDAIGRILIRRVDRHTILLPGVHGFEAKRNRRGPVTNLSYYFYAAFELFEKVRPEYPWRELTASGRELTRLARFGRYRQVPDWVSVDTQTGYPHIARGFEPKSAYDAVRIPLYMAYSGLPADDLQSFDAAWAHFSDGVPREVNFQGRTPPTRMNDSGYRYIAQLTACRVRGVPITGPDRSFRPTTYFSSSLHLIGLIAARRHNQGCGEYWTAAAVQRSRPMVATN
mgnify:CR=1 FL=1